MGRFNTTDKLFRDVILRERKNACEWCSKSGVIHIAHILPKGAHPRLRYQRLNVLLLCVRCHLFRAHKSPLEFQEWITSYKGKTLLDDLRILERTLPKTDLKMIKMSLEDMLKDLT